MMIETVEKRFAASSGRLHERFPLRSCEMAGIPFTRSVISGAQRGDEGILLPGAPAGGFFDKPAYWASSPKLSAVVMVATLVHRGAKAASTASKSSPSAAQVSVCLLYTSRCV